MSKTTPPSKKRKQGSEKKVFSAYEYKKEGRKGTLRRTEKYRECLTIRRG